MSYPIASPADLRALQKSRPPAISPQESFAEPPPSLPPSGMPTPLAETSAEDPKLPPQTPPTTAVPSKPTDPDPLYVLVVDDDRMTRSLMTRMLTRQGCLVDTAEDGQKFLDLVTSPTARKYDLISLDNFMPVMTGEQAVREFRALGRTDLVVGCTGMFHWIILGSI